MFQKFRELRVGVLETFDEIFWQFHTEAQKTSRGKKEGSDDFGGKFTKREKIENIDELAEI